MPREPLYGLTQIDRDRTSRAVREYEDQLRNPPPAEELQRGMIQSQVMRMTTPISWGETGLALPVKATRQDDGTIHWNPISDGQYQVAMIGGNRNRIDKGCFVQCVLTQDGWVIVNSWVMGVAISINPIPFGCYAMGSTGTSFLGHIELGHAHADHGSYGIHEFDRQPWELDYCFGTEIDTSLPTNERSPVGTVVKGLGQQGFGDTSLNRLYPVQTSLPAWVAYSRDADASIPDEVLEALGWDTEEHPNAGERWGPTRDDSFKIARTAQVLPLYWWEWVIPPASEVQKITLTNAPASGTWKYELDGVLSSSVTVTANAAAVQTAIEAMSNVGAGNVSVSGSVGGPYTITFQGDLADQSINSGSFIPTGGPSGSPSGFVSTVQDGSDEIKRQFIAPNGWWGSWGWSGWGWSGIYPHLHWWYSGITSSYYGSWGYNWWSGRWGGFPPKDEDIVYDGTDPPAPPEGTLTKYCVHSYVVWQYGWRVISVDQEREICFVAGNIEFERSQVVVNGSIEDCPGYDAGAGT